MSTVIRVENLGKKYLIKHQEQERYVALRDVIASRTREVRHRLVSRQGSKENDQTIPVEEFWALKDICFEVKQGDRIGIIGRNGAGKSTLLKILSRITEPSAGRVSIKGRVASLLEVGTGFHPELTGRENIYLNGAILGMSRAEINKKFDEIVEFAEVEKFLDTPVKRYSSGMYMRLAFAVAANLDNDILLVDEVLAVGDAQFQKKCLGKLGELGGSEKTILFVSHNLAAIQRLCQTGVYLASGRIQEQGEIAKVLHAYQKSMNTTEKLDNREVTQGMVRFLEWKLVNADTGLPHSCYSREYCIFNFTIVSKRKVPSAYLGFAIWTEDQQLVFAASSVDKTGVYFDIENGIYEAEFKVKLPLKEGSYQLDVSFNSLEAGQLDRWQANPRLIILPQQESNLPEYWQGILNEESSFGFSQIGGK